MATSQIEIHVLSGIRDVTNPPGLLWVGARPFLTFDGTTNELLTWTFRLPVDYASGLTVKWQYSMASATTNNVAVRSQIMAVSSGGTINVDSYDTLDKSADATVPGTVGIMDEISFALTNIDSAAAGDYIAVQLGRENGTTGTNATGDMYVWEIALTYTTV